jgi:hypothetical protein
MLLNLLTKQDSKMQALFLLHKRQDSNNALVWYSGHGDVLAIQVIGYCTNIITPVNQTNMIHLFCYYLENYKFTMLSVEIDADQI